MLKFKTLIVITFITVLKLHGQYQHHILVIKSFLTQNNSEKAIEYINNNNIETINSPDVYAVIAQTYYYLNNIEKAADFYIKAANNKPGLYCYELSQCYSKLNKPNIAIQYLQEYLSTDNKIAENKIKHNDVFFNLSKTNEWNKLWKTDWYSNNELIIIDAVYEQINNRHYETINILNQINNKNKIAHKANYIKSVSYLKLNQHKNALTTINNAINQSPKNAGYYYQKSQVEYAQKNFKKALKTINKAFEYDSTEIDYYFTKAQLLTTTNDTKNAINLINQLLELKPDKNAYIIAAQIFTDANEYFEAIKYLNKSISYEPYNVKLYIMRANLYMQTNTFAYAEKDYTFALDSFPFNGEIYFNRALARLKQQKLELACTDFIKAHQFGYSKANSYIEQYCRKYIK